MKRKSIIIAVSAAALVVAPAANATIIKTGGSTGLKPLADRIAARFPAARVMRGVRFASVAQGLGIHATRVFGSRI